MIAPLLSHCIAVRPLGFVLITTRTGQTARSAKLCTHTTGRAPMAF